MIFWHNIKQRLKNDTQWIKDNVYFVIGVLLLIISLPFIFSPIPFGWVLVPFIFWLLLKSKKGRELIHHAEKIKYIGGFFKKGEDMADKKK